MSQPEATVNQLAAALRYAALGWPVFPLHTPSGEGCSCLASDCKSIGKHPRTMDGFKSATTEETRIRGWWRTWPLANIGIAAGARSGFFVVDVDPDKGGDASLGVLLSEHGQLPETVEALTGSGGRHILLAHPGRPIPNSTSRLGAGLDVRGDGGYIVAAPSLHKAGTTYEWQPGCAPGQCSLALAPEWLLELLRPPAPPPAQASADRAYARATAYIARMPQAISGAGGHDSLWDVALACVRGFRLSESEALALILSDYNPRCDPPWSEKEILHKVRDAEAHAQVPYGYLLDAERGQPPPREPGSDDGEPAKAKSRLGLQPVARLLAEIIPPTEWLISPWLEAGSVAALVAPPNLGKTLLALWFATQTKGRVAIIEEEGGKRGFQKRIDRALRAVGGDTGRIDYAFKPRISLMNRADILALSDELKAYAFVIIDSFARVTTGVEENDTKEMGIIVSHLDYIRERTGATSFSLHHTAKSKWKPGEVPRLGDGRGSSAFEAGMDTVLALAPVQNPEPGMVKFELHITKQRDEDNQVPPRLVRINMQGPSADVLMEEIERRRTPSPDEARITALVAVVLMEIPEPPAAAISREDLQDRLGRRPTDIRAAVNILLDRKQIKELSRKRLIRVPSSYRERAE